MDRPEARVVWWLIVALACNAALIALMTFHLIELKIEVKRNTASLKENTKSIDDAVDAFEKTTSWLPR